MLLHKLLTGGANGTILKSMTVEFTEEQEQFIQRQLATGRFASEADVIKQAVSLWQEREKNVEEMRDLFREAHKRNAHVDPEEAEEAMKKP